MKLTFLPSQEAGITNARVGDDVKRAGEREHLCRGVKNWKFLEGGAQEDKGKHDGINGFGNGLGLRTVMLGRRHALIFTSTWLSQLLGPLRSANFFPAFQCPHSPSPQRATILMAEQYLMCLQSFSLYVNLTPNL